MKVATKPISRTAAKAAPLAHRRYCAARWPAPAPAARGMAENRKRLLRETAYKWMNGTTIRYWFYDKPARLVGPQHQKDVVREAFALWKAVGLGLDFKEVTASKDADLRIAFDQSPAEGSWSYIGTDCLSHEGPTMNFGWRLDGREGMDTALHEIGHALGFPHEHQNPFAGIVWDEEAVYRALKAPPNRWSRKTTFHNILEKIAPDTVQGSDWDPNSVMHYPFEPGLILKPVEYRNGIKPRGGLSERDRAWAKHFYPPTGAVPPLTAFKSTPLSLAPGGQADFDFVADATRTYSFATFGEADTHLALHRVKSGRLEPIAEDDDGGVDRNAQVKTNLAAGDKVRVQVRMRYIEPGGAAAVMAW